MPLPFDATLKDLVREYPADWVSALLAPPREKSVRLVTPDLSTVTAFADVVLMVGEEVLLHADFQTGPDANLPRRVLLYTCCCTITIASPCIAWSSCCGLAPTGATSPGGFGMRCNPARGTGLHL